MTLPEKNCIYARSTDLKIDGSVLGDEKSNEDRRNGHDIRSIDALKNWQALLSGTPLPLWEH